MKENRRDHKRKEFIIPVQILYEDPNSSAQQEMLAKTVDLSLGGARLEVSDITGVDKIDYLNIKLPDANEKISPEAKIQWKTEQENRFEVGLQFTSISTSEQLKIKRFLERSSDEDERNDGPPQNAPHIQYEKFITYLKNSYDFPPEKNKPLDGLSPNDLYSANGRLGLENKKLAQIIADFLGVKYIDSLQSVIVDQHDMTKRFCQKNHILPILDERGEEGYVLSNPFKSVWGSVLNHRGFKFDRYFITEPKNIRRYFNGNRSDEVEHHPTNSNTNPDESMDESRATSDGTFVMKTDTTHEQQIESLVQTSSNGGAQEPDPRASREEAQNENVVRLANQILSAGVKQEASDIHIEPRKNHLEVRFRLDGVLKKMWEFPERITEPLITRIKIMAQLDIAERRMPQDGGFRISYNNRDIDIRTSVIPQNTGEKAVLRVLDKNSVPQNLSELGFKTKTTNLLEEALESTKGILYFTGPTGSGKTTSLYTCLSKLMNPKVNIQTVENPIEYNMEGVNQMQINPKAGLTFAKALRGILRQDPDILMLGEIRDYETLDIAVKAAMSGHLVLSTVHTNDAPSTVNRLLNIGVDSYCVASTTRIIVAQRLIRQLCTKCKEPAENPEKHIEKYPVLEQFDPTIFETVGCEHCEQTGYKGQMGVMECIPSSEVIRQAIREKKGTDHIRNIMTDELGLNTLQENALKKVADGKTSLEEALRITSS